MGQKHLTHSESLSFNTEATCLLLSSPGNFLKEIQTDKYRPCPSTIAMFTSDSQHPPRSRHAVYLGEKVIVITPGDRYGSNQESMDYRLSLMPYRREQFNACIHPSVRPSIRPSVFSFIHSFIHSVTS